MNESDPRWDAQTLADAKVIEGDPTRLAAAKNAAAELAKEEAAKAKAMKNVATGRKTRVAKDDTTNFIPRSLL